MHGFFTAIMKVNVCGLSSYIAMCVAVSTGVPPSKKTQFCIPYLILPFVAHTFARRHVPKPYVLKYCRPPHNVPAGPKTIQLLTLRLLMSYIYIYMEHLFLMFLDHTQRRSTVGRTPLDE